MLETIIIIGIILAGLHYFHKPKRRKLQAKLVFCKGEDCKICYPSK